MAEVVAWTDRLCLRTWDEPDELAFYDVMNTAPVMRWLGGQQSPEQWNAAFERLRGYEHDFGFTFWIVERLADDAILGFCGLKRANAPGSDHIEGEVEIGWRLREDAWGQGYAKEAAIASLDLAFGQFNAPRVIAMTATDNLPSQRLMKRLGMIHREAWTFVDQRFAPDDPVNPQVVFVIEAANWPVARAAALA